MPDNKRIVQGFNFDKIDDYCRLTRRQLTANKQQAKKKEPLEVIADRTRRYLGMSFLVKQNNIEQLLKNGDRIYITDPNEEYKQIEAQLKQSANQNNKSVW